MAKSKKNTHARGDYLDLHEEDSWVVVKKQRVTILIPRLPDARMSNAQEPRLINPDAVPANKTVCRSGLSGYPIQTPVRMPPLHDLQERVTSMAPKRGASPLRHTSSSHKLLLPGGRSDNADRANAFVGHNMPRRASNVSRKTIQRPQLLRSPDSLLNGAMLLNQRLRASLLERKLRKAGGLNMWLSSLGLGQFVRIFRGRCVSKFQLVNLTMKKLKDMGAEAVGPRRKLMHAIDCLCQPSCFEYPKSR